MLVSLFSKDKGYLFFYAGEVEVGRRTHSRHVGTADIILHRRYQTRLFSRLPTLTGLLRLFLNSGFRILSKLPESVIISCKPDEVAFFDFVFTHFQSFESWSMCGES